MSAVATTAAASLTPANLTTNRILRRRTRQCWPGQRSGMTPEREALAFGVALVRKREYVSANDDEPRTDDEDDRAHGDTRSAEEAEKEQERQERSGQESPG